MKKLLSMILTMLMLLSVICVAPVSVGAAQVDVAETGATITGGQTLYLKPNSNWTQANARFAMYLCNGSSAATWVSMTQVDDASAVVYEATVPAGQSHKNVIFCRMNPSNTTNDWNNKWNQTSDLTWDGTKNCYEVKSGTWDKGGGTWGTYTAPAPAQPGDASGYFLMGTLTDWATGQNMVYAEDTAVVTTTIEAEAGTYAIKVKNGDNWMGAAELTLPTSIEGGTIDAADVDGNVALTLDGGTYTFNFTMATKALAIEYTAPEVEPTEAPTDAPVVEEPTEEPTEAPTDAPEVEPTEAPTDAPVAETMTIYFENNWNWPDAKVYYWGSTTGTNPEWPGFDMTYVDTLESGAKRYSIEVPTDITGMLFNGTGEYGSEQCVDITGDWYDGICYYMTYDGATNTKPAGSYEYAPIVTPEPTEAPTDAPEIEPTEAPTEAPTDAPEVEPTEAPTEAPTDAPVVPEYITIYFTNNWGWTDVRVHNWGSAFEPETSWPGKTMDLVETNDFGQDIYTAQIPADATTVVFTGTNSSGGLDQSSNTVVKDGYGYYMEWTEELGSHAVEYEYVPTVTPDPTEATADEPEVEPTEAPTEAPTDVPEDVEIITVFFQNNWLWSDIRIHIWGSSVSYFNTEWPGVEMAYYDNDGTYDYYSFNLPADIEGFQINGLKDDGTGSRDQTPDIKEGFYDGICYYMMWSDGNQAGSESIDNIFTPVEPPTSGGEGGEGSEPEIAPGLLGTTVTLGGNLGVNFWFDVNDDIVADENAKVLVTLPNGTQLEVPLTELTWVNSDYVYTAEIAAKEMTDVITVQLVATDFATEVYSYTVADYCYDILSDPEAYPDEQALVKALLNYGAAAQVYFGYNTDALANDTELMTADEKVLANADLSAYAPVIVGEGDAIKYRGASLVLEDETAIKFHFIVDESKLPEGVEPSININGKPSATLVKNGTLYTIKIDNISAHRLGATYELAIGNGCTITYSALSYAYNAQQKVEKPALVDLANALAAYSAAAVAYNN